MMDMTHTQAQTRIRQYIRKLGIDRAILKQGGEEGDILTIAGKEIPSFKRTSWQKN